MEMLHDRPGSARGARGASLVRARGELPAKLQDLESTLRLLQTQVSPGEARMLGQLLHRLTVARDCLQGSGERRRFRADEAQFWEIVHGVAADMLLVLPPTMLATKAIEVDEQFRRNIQEPIARQTWLGADGLVGPLPQAVRTVMKISGGSASDDAGLLHARNVLRGALRLVNEQTDQHVRQLAFALLVRSLSSALLVLLFLAAFFFERKAWLPLSKEVTFGTSEELKLPLVSLVLLGAGGAIVANMSSEPPVLAARGPAWRQLLYYLFVRPAIGGFAAFLFYLLAQSGLIFGIETTTGSPISPQPPATRIVLGSDTARHYAYAIISIIVGFSADRVLSPVMDQVLNRLSLLANKSVLSPDLQATALAKSMVLQQMPSSPDGPQEQTQTPASSVKPTASQQDSQTPH